MGRTAPLCRLPQRGWWLHPFLAVFLAQLAEGVLERLNELVTLDSEAERGEPGAEQLLERRCAEFEAVTERLCAEHDLVFVDVRLVGTGRNQSTLRILLVLLEKVVILEDVADERAAAEETGDDLLPVAVYAVLAAVGTFRERIDDGFGKQLLCHILTTLWLVVCSLYRIDRLPRDARRSIRSRLVVIGF